MPLKPLAPLKFTGVPADLGNLSAVHVVGNTLLVASDEGVAVQVLRGGPDSYQFQAEIRLSDGKKELDLEGLANDGEWYYAVGSHAMKRDKTKDEFTLEKNRKRLAKISPESSRDVLVRFQLTAEGGIANRTIVSLRKFINADPFLGRFATIPSKENGVDIEGLATADGHLYIGFRGPVLRGNWTPILRCDFAKDIRTGTLLWVNLGGRGVRDLCRIEGGLLVLAGPVGDGPGTFDIHQWDGHDCLIGSERPADQPVGLLTKLGEIPRVKHHNPEGIALMHETDCELSVVVVYDGLPLEQSARYCLTR